MPHTPRMESLQLIGTTEAAKRLGKHRSTVVRWARNGILPFVVEVPGYRGDFLFDPASVEALREGKAA